MHLFKFLTSYPINVLKISLTVILFCLAKIMPLVAQRKYEEHQITEYFKKCEQTLKDWVVKPAVIGGSSFGSSSKGPKTELKVCPI